MDTWNPKDVTAIAAAEEIQIVTRRADGTTRRPRIIWVVTDGGRVFIRSTNGRSADWFRWAIATGTGQLIVRGAVHEVRFAEADEGDIDGVDAAYRSKYRRYPSITDHLAEQGPRAATLQVHPA